MAVRRVAGAKFVSGDASAGVLVLTRDDGSTAQCGVVIVRGTATVTDNGDSTVTLTLSGGS